MKFSLRNIVTVALAGQGALASSWFSKAAYNKWHETELERWLSDNNVPYPSPADRKDLENLIKKNWDDKILTPYNEWDSEQIANYLKWKGLETKEDAKASKDTLLAKVKTNWYETENSANEAYLSVRDWIFDSWTESSLKSYCDKHKIPVPQPRARDTYIKAARENYQTVADKLKETASYPGNWLYGAWSESELKEWLDMHGVPAPQPSTRDKLVASVRRNSRLASVRGKQIADDAQKYSDEARDRMANMLLDSWSDSQIKEWADKNGIPVPQGSKRNELIALARKNKALLFGDTAASTVSSAFGAATSSAANTANKIGEDAKAKAEDLFNQAVDTWSDSRLKSYLDARGVPVPQGGKADELKALVRKHAHKAATGYSAWTFDTWTKENLQKYLKQQNKKAAVKAGATRDELVKSAQDSYASASKSGGTAYASATSYLAQATDNAKDATFDTWTDSDLKSYLDSYGIPVYQGTKTEELKALARRQYNYFRYGTSSPAGTIFARIQEGFQWVLGQLQIGAAEGQKQAAQAGQKAADYGNEAASSAKHRASEAAQRASDKVKEEL